LSALPDEAGREELPLISNRERGEDVLMPVCANNFKLNELNRKNPHNKN